MEKDCINCVLYDIDCNNFCISNELNLNLELIELLEIINCFEFCNLE
jgi:hypothetical protein